MRNLLINCYPHGDAIEISDPVIVKRGSFRTVAICTKSIFALIHAVN